MYCTATTVKIRRSVISHGYIEVIVLGMETFLRMIKLLFLEGGTVRNGQALQSREVIGMLVAAFSTRGRLNKIIDLEIR